MINDAQMKLAKNHYIKLISLIEKELERFDHGDDLVKSYQDVISDLREKVDYAKFKIKETDLIKEFNGRYRGTGFSIKTSKSHVEYRKDHWCFYIYIKNQYENYVDFQEMDFHGGITYLHGFTDNYYDIFSSDLRESNKYLKIGCDYQHLGDEGKTYTFDSVYRDVRRCIDSGIELGVLTEENEDD